MAYWSNHKLVPLSHRLQGGDQVEVLTSNSQHVEPSWINFVSTAKAKSKKLIIIVLALVLLLVLGNLLAAQGAALMDELMQGVLSVVAHWLGPDTAIQMAASYAGTPAGVTDGSAAIAVIGGADGPTAIFVTSRYNAQALWGLAVKVFSNVLVIVLNYVFSKLIIFKKK